MKRSGESRRFRSGRITWLGRDIRIGNLLEKCKDKKCPGVGEVDHQIELDNVRSIENDLENILFINSKTDKVI